jgi:phosphonoacetaldehyde dehydrogenase
VTLLESPLLEPSCLVGGREERGAERFEVRYPYTGEVIGTAPLLDEATVATALDLAAGSRVRLDRFERSGVLNRVADAVAARGTELARLITLESGLSLKDTRHEVERAMDVFRFAARETLRDDGEVFASDVSSNGRARRALTMREPVRLVAAITPFNHPLNQVAHKLAPAIGAGAPIVLKPSEKTPLAGLWLGRLVIEVGYPEDALAVVTGDREQILDQMLAHEAVEVVSFTGGIPAGRLIARHLGPRRAVLELGGNDPLLVLADADLDRAAQLAVEGATRNSGQRCTAVKRILADRSLADGLVDRIVERTAQLVVGDPLHPDTDVGTVIDEEAAKAIGDRVEAAVRAGATLRHGGERTGAQLVPPVLDDVPPDAELVADETFGPAVPVIRVDGVSEAIDVANGTRYGLSAGVVSNNLDWILRCVHELRVGTVNVDEVPGFRTEDTPFGGVKASGIGVKEGVVEAMRGFTNVKLVTLPWFTGP